MAKALRPWFGQCGGIEDVIDFGLNLPVYRQQTMNEGDPPRFPDKAESAKPLDTQLRGNSNYLKDHPVVVSIGITASILSILAFFGLQWPSLSLTSPETDAEGKAAPTSSETETLPVPTLEVGEEQRLPSPSSQQTSEGSLEIFRPGSPYPVGFEVPKLGARLTDVKTFYEGVEVDLFAPEVNYVGLTVTLRNNFFGRITYSFGQPVVDPILISITFYPIDDEVMTQVRKEALVAFADDSHETFALGEIIQWNDVRGVKVVVGQENYTIWKINL